MTIAAQPPTAAGPSIDDAAERRIFRYSCGECGRPAVSFDSEGSPRCPTHVDRFLPATARGYLVDADDIDG